MNFGALKRSQPSRRDPYQSEPKNKKEVESLTIENNNPSQKSSRGGRVCRLFSMTALSLASASQFRGLFSLIETRSKPHSADLDIFKSLKMNATNLDVPNKGEKHQKDNPFCAPPSVYGGSHQGTLIEILPKEASPRGTRWTWRTCASECAKRAECDFWILPLRGKETHCKLLADMGEYQEKGARHLEGVKDPGCLDVRNPVMGKLKNAYYINLAKNTLRRRNIEQWLNKTSLTYTRIEAIQGKQSDSCEKPLNEHKCRGAAGLTLSNLKIIENGDHSGGHTLVFEDDAFVRDIAVMEASLSLVPDDWDIVRWNCGKKENVPASFPWVNEFTFRSVHEGGCTPSRKNHNCQFFGGTRAMLWKNESLPKLREVWAKRPYGEIDGRLTTEKLKSYCVDIGPFLIHRAPREEKSDIQLKLDGSAKHK